MKLNENSALDPAVEFRKKPIVVRIAFFNGDYCYVTVDKDPGMTRTLDKLKAAGYQLTCIEEIGLKAYCVPLMRSNIKSILALLGFKLITPTRSINQEPVNQMPVIKNGDWLPPEDRYLSARISSYLQRRNLTSLLKLDPIKSRFELIERADKQSREVVQGVKDDFNSLLLDIDEVFEYSAFEKEALQDKLDANLRNSSFFVALSTFLAIILACNYLVQQ